MKKGRGRPRKSLGTSRESTPTSETKRKKSERGGGIATPDASSSRGASAAPSPCSSRSSTPVSMTMSRSSTPSEKPTSTRRSTRAAAQKSKQLIQEVITSQTQKSVSAPVTPKPAKPKPSSKKPVKYQPADSSDESEPEEYFEESDIVDDDSSSNSSASEAESEPSAESEGEESDGSTPSKKRVPPRIFRPPTPVWLEKEDIPEIELPKSSNDLLIENKDLLDAISVYEVLRHFYQQLRLSLFRFEDFCAALVSEEQCNMLAEIHISLMRALLREEDGSSTTFGPHDCRDSINIQLFLLDGMTWPEVVRSYIESDKDFQDYLPFVESELYPFLTVKDKVKVLQFLTDQFLASNKVREEILGEGAITYDDHCRSCHRLGDLLCCETCSAVYHLECVVPPLYEVPEDDWLCAVCLEHQVPGVVDCVSEVEKSGMLIRHEPLGYDRNGRKYYHVCRRIIVESEDGDVRYYSCKAQLEELLHTLDPMVWEKDLFLALIESKGEILTHMEKTEELTNNTRGTQRSTLQRINDELGKIQKEREEAEAEKLRQEEEAKKKEEEEAKKKEEEAAQKAKEEAGEVSETKMEEKQSMSDDKPTESTNESKPSEEALQKSNEETKDGSVETPSKSTESAPTNGSGETKTNTETKMEFDSVVTKEEKPSEIGADDGASSEKKEPSADGKEEEKKEVEDVDVKMEDKQEDEPTKTGVMTRSRNPNYKPPPPKTSPFVNYSTATPIGVRKVGDQEDSVLVINAKGEIKRMETRKLDPQQGHANISIKVGDSDFRLGMEGNYKLYKNQFSANRLGLNKPQHAELRDKTRYLSHKFSLTPQSEFKWNGTVYGNRILTTSTLRLSITQLETSITKPFMHTNWPAHRTNWIKAVHMCNKPHEFALALSILECAIKPVVFNPVWLEALGHTTLMRTTAMEREEKKKADKKRKDYDPLDDIYADRSTWVKCSFPLKHSIWKWKGEEYRITSGNGWMWLSKTRRRRHLPAPSPAKLCVDASTKKAVDANSYIALHGIGKPKKFKPLPDEGTNQIPDTPLPEKQEKKPKLRPRRGPKLRGHAKRAAEESTVHVTGEGDASSAMETNTKTEDKQDGDGEKMEVDIIAADKKEEVEGEKNDDKADEKSDEMKESKNADEKLDEVKESEKDAKEDVPMETS